MNNNEEVKPVKQMAKVITSKEIYNVSIPTFKQICEAIENQRVMIDINAYSQINLFFNNDSKPFELVLPVNQIVAMRVTTMD